MSANPAVSVYARVAFQQEEIRKNVKATTDTIKTEFAKATAVSIPLNIDAKDIQKKVNAALAGIKVAPIVIPLQFGAPGSMPGMGGGMPMGASSPNWANYFYGIQQQLQAMTPTSSPNWSVLMAGRGGGTQFGGGGGSNLFNPFSPRGLARLYGSGLAAYGAIAATQLATGFIEAGQISSHPERVLREFDKIGGRHDVTSDPVMIQQAAQIAGIQGEKKILETLESVPLLGTLAKFVDALSGATHALDDQEHAARRQIELHQEMQQTSDELRIRSAASTGDPLRVAAEGRRAALQSAFKVENDALAESARADIRLAESPEGQQTEWEIRKRAADAARATAKAATAQRIQVAAQSETERAASEKQEGARNASAASKIYIAGEQASAAEMSFGDTVGALSHAQNAETEAIRVAYNGRIAASPEGSAERARLIADRDAAISAAQAKQGLEMGKAVRGRASSRAGLSAEGEEISARLGGNTDEASRIALRDKQRRRRESIEATDRGALDLDAGVSRKESAELEDTIRRRRGLEAGGSAARIGSMGGRAGEAEMRARGEEFNAAFAAAARTIDEHVEQLKREAAAEKDATKAKQLLNEATHAQIAGDRELAAMQAAHELASKREIRQTESETGADLLRASGQERGARDKSLNDQQREERIRIQNAQDPNWMEQLQASDRKFAAKRAMNRHEDQIQDLHLEHMTQDAEARAKGQQGVGGVFAIQEEVARMRENAGNDPEKLRNVRRYANARYAEMQRELKPVPAIHGLADYHDSLQMSIISGHSNTQALNLIKAIQGREGWLPSPAGGAGGNAAGGGGGGINDAAKQLVDAAQIIKKAKVIGVIGGK